MQSLPHLFRDAKEAIVGKMTPPLSIQSCSACWRKAHPVGCTKERPHCVVSVQASFAANTETGTGTRRGGTGEGSVNGHLSVAALSVVSVDVEVGLASARSSWRGGGLGQMGKRGAEGTSGVRSHVPGAPAPRKLHEIPNSHLTSHMLGSLDCYPT